MLIEPADERRVGHGCARLERAAWRAVEHTTQRLGRHDAATLAAHAIGDDRGVGLAFPRWDPGIGPERERVRAEKIVGAVLILQLERQLLAAMGRARRHIDEKDARTVCDRAHGVGQGRAIERAVETKVRGLRGTEADDVRVDDIDIASDEARLAWKGSERRCAVGVEA